MAANLFWYLHYYFFLKHKEIHIVKTDDHYQHIRSNQTFDVTERRAKKMFTHLEYLLSLIHI